MVDEKSPTVYILASSRNGTLYIGVTSNLCARVSAHRQGLCPGFAKRYGVNHLVYYEHHGTMDGAIRREKQMKELKRAWKTELIERDNPNWLDRFGELRGSDELFTPDRLRVWLRSHQT